MREISLIVNPISGNGKALKILPEIKSYFNMYSDNIKLNVLISRYKGNIEELAKDLYENGVREFVVLGGDGSLSELINGLAQFEDPEIIVGIIPYGSGNDYVKTLYEGYTLNNIFQSIISQNTRLIDIGKVNEWYFINSCSFGIDGPIIKSTDFLKQKLKGELAYYFSTLKEGVRFKSKNVKISIDGLEIEGKKLLIAFNKGKYFGGGMKITPDAEIDDGRLSVCIVDDIPKMFFLKSVKKIYDGTLDDIDAVHYTKCKFAKINVEVENYDINIDGNLVGKTPAKIEVKEKALKIYK